MGRKSNIHNENCNGQVKRFDDASLLSRIFKLEAGSWMVESKETTLERADFAIQLLLFVAVEK